MSDEAADDLQGTSNIATLSPSKDRKAHEGIAAVFIRFYSSKHFPSKRNLVYFLTRVTTRYVQKYASLPQQRPQIEGLLL